MTITSKQFGDAAEFLVLSELTFAGIPAAKMPDNWPGYDLIAQPANIPPQRINVKACRWSEAPGRFIIYKKSDDFEWIAFVLNECPGEVPRRVFIIPREVLDAKAMHGKATSKVANESAVLCRRIPVQFPEYESNFKLVKFATVADTPSAAVTWKNPLLVDSPR
jgi:hypothetical protein